MSTGSHRSTHAAHASTQRAVKPARYKKPHLKARGRLLMATRGARKAAR